MAHNDIEIEIQVKIENSQALLDFLQKQGQFKGEKRQIDEYFTPIHRDFLAARPTVEWLRLRDSNGSYSINYKNWHVDEQGRSHFADEHESKIENIESCRKILLALNFTSRIVVDKTRKIWVYEDYEVALDSIKGLGDFVEIEYLGKEQTVNPVEVTNKMIDFLKQVGCGKIQRNYVGYPFMLMFPNEVGWEIA
jgi:adenylate cyclase class 2